MKKTNIFHIALTAVMAALASVLMYVEISVPLMPFFVKLEVSDFPALVTGIIAGPLWGVLVCLVKCAIHLPATYSGGIGELANFLIGASYVLTASLIHGKINRRGGVILGGACGAFAMAAVAYPVNYFITYPVYAKLMPISEILAAYQAIYPKVDGLASALLIFNTPFNLIKGLLITLVAALTYEAISPLNKKYGRKRGADNDAQNT